jgi:hypothetical protein
VKAIAPDVLTAPLAEVPITVIRAHTATQASATVILTVIAPFTNALSRMVSVVATKMDTATARKAVTQVVLAACSATFSIVRNA